MFGTYANTCIAFECVQNYCTHMLCRCVCFSSGTTRNWYVHCTVPPWHQVDAASSQLGPAGPASQRPVPGVND